MWGWGRWCWGGADGVRVGQMGWGWDRWCWSVGDGLGCGRWVGVEQMVWGQAGSLGSSRWFGYVMAARLVRSSCVCLF